MLYCIKCGDPIEKDELICDKCGFHFTILEGSPAKVYMNQVPGKNAGVTHTAGMPANPVQQSNNMYSGNSAQQQNNMYAGQPMQPQNVRPQATMMPARPMQTQNPAMQVRPMQPQGQMMQQRPVQGQPGYGQRPVQGQPGYGQMPVQNVAKPKKKKKALWITLAAVGGSLAVICLLVALFIGVFVITGSLMGNDEQEIIVNNQDGGNGANGQTTASIVYDNSNAQSTPEDEYIANAIRDPFVNLKGNGEDTVTVMLYLNGADLESDGGMATQDIREILNATLSDKVNVVIQTGGTRKWQTSAIASDHSQRFVVENGGLTLVDDSLGQLDITDPQTLEDFINFCKTNYPANRNMLILWNHGAGAVYGFGYDEHVDDYNAALTLDEIQTAIRNTGVKFEMIGFDACLMGGLETACAFYDTADYLIASEDFESGKGWEYQNWLTILGTNSSTPMEDVAKVIIDDFVKESNSCRSDGILALVDLRYTRLLFQAWIDFAYSAQDDLLACNYSMEMQRTDRASFHFDTPMERLLRDPWQNMFDTTETTLQEYNYAVDLMALADTLDTEEAQALEAALSSALVYCSATLGDSEMTGLSITLPYNSAHFYDSMEEVYTNCGFDAEYIDFLESFVDADTTETYDWGQSDWSGWESYEEEEYDWEEWDQWEEYQETDFGWDEYDYSNQWDSWYN